MRNLLALTVFTIFAIFGVLSVKERIEGGEVYEIIGSFNGSKGILTALNNTNNATVVLGPYNDTMDTTEKQRWLAEEEGELWIFRLNDAPKLMLTVDDSQDSYFSRLSTKGKHRRWTVTSLKNKGDNAVQIMNNKNSTCIRSQGFNLPVADDTACEDKDEFIWRFKKVST